MIWRITSRVYSLNSLGPNIADSNELADVLHCPFLASLVGGLRLVVRYSAHHVWNKRCIYATHIVNRSHEILADSRRGHSSCNGFHIASWGRVYALLRVRGVDHMLCTDVSNRRHCMRLLSRGRSVIPLELER